LNCNKKILEIELFTFYEKGIIIGVRNLVITILNIGIKKGNIDIYVY